MIAVTTILSSAPRSRSLRPLLGKVAFAVSLSCLLLCDLSAAKTPDQKKAEALFRAGRAAMAQHNYGKACRRFVESDKLDHAIGTVFNLARCHQVSGQLASAWKHYSEVVKKLPADDDRRVFAAEQVAILEPRLAHIAIKLSNSVPDYATILIDGVAISAESVGWDLPMDPGEHTVIVKAKGYEHQGYVLVAHEGQREVWRLDIGAMSANLPVAALAPAEQVAEEPTATEDVTKDRQNGLSRKNTGYIIGGVGVTGFAAALLSGSIALSKSGDVDNGCVSDPNASGRACSQSSIDAAASGKTWLTVADISLVVGVVGVGIGGYLVFTSDDNDSETALGARALPGGGAFTVRHSF